MGDRKTSEGERLVKLALYIQRNAPVDFVAIRRALHEYAFLEGDDAEAQRKNDQKVRRMFERDKAALESFGMRIVADGDNRYTLDASRSFSAPLDIAPAEASLLRLVCAALLEDESYPLKAELRMALAKISDELDMPDMYPHIGTTDGAVADAKSPALRKIQKAVAGRKRLSFTYRDMHGRESQREVEPFGCYFLNKHCYVVAHDTQSGEDRRFRFDRMSGLKVNGAKTPDFEARPFDVSAWRVLPFQIGGELFDATVFIDAHNAWRAEALRQGFGELEEREDGLLWHVEARDAQRLASWCAQVGPGVVPVDPPGVVDAFREGLRRVLEVCA